MISSGNLLKMVNMRTLFRLSAQDRMSQCKQNVWKLLRVLSYLGEIPSGALVIGKTVEGEPLYMGRCLYQGTQTPGKIHPTHGCLYIPFDGEEISVNEYEVLVLK